MREAIARHAAPLATAALLLAVAGTMAALLPPYGLASVPYASPFPKAPIVLGDPDSDGDSYGDDVDRSDGDRLLLLTLERVLLPKPGEPYLAAGTQDDQWRFGAGRELAWRHVVDFDPLGLDPGSPRWQKDALRTGTWVATEPAEGERWAFGEGRSFPGAPGARFPQELVLNVRDDVQRYEIQIELRDARTSPHRLLASWTLQVDLDEARVHSGPASAPLGAPLTLVQGASEAVVRVADAVDLDVASKQAIAEGWAPRLRFDSGEAFFPVPGAALEQFHGFFAVRPNLRTWDPDFNNGRDGYRLLLADYDGDRQVDRNDALVMTGLLSASPTAGPTIHAQVAKAHNGAVVVQYWLLYFYDFVLDREGRDIPVLTHAGDREFLQLTFPSVAAARNGTPDEAILSQHYGGVRIAYEPGKPPFADDPIHPTVYVAAGSHANYPVPGDNRRLLPAFTGFHDRFDGKGPTWEPGSYRIDVLGNQTWHAGYLWGPATRFNRDLGTSLRPMLNHDFRYPFTDPAWWAAGLDVVRPEDMADLYGEAPRR